MKAFTHTVIGSSNVGKKDKTIYERRQFYFPVILIS